MVQHSSGETEKKKREPVLFFLFLLLRFPSGFSPLDLFPHGDCRHK